jgi:excinuclease ABC subunit B
MMPAYLREPAEPFRTQDELDAHIATLQAQMKAAAANLDFEKAASIRDDVRRLRDQELGLPVRRT